MPEQDPRQPTFVAYGIPAPKGSTRSFAVRKAGVLTGGVATTAASPRLREWDASIREAIHREAMTGTGHIAGPVYAHIVFWLPRPKSHPKSRRTWPAVVPDLDKLARAVLDPMSGTLIEDDSRVVGLLVEKDYTTYSPDPRPRAEVWVWPVTGGTP